MPALPVEITTLIVESLVASEGDVSEQWLIRRRAKHRKWQPLRALTQVSRNWRAAAMRELWRSIKLHPAQDDFYAITHLRQLVEELRHPFGARQYLQHVNLTLTLSRMGGSYHPREERIFIDDCLDGLDPEEIHADYFQQWPITSLARILTKQFIDCPNLQTLRWKGWLQGDLVLLDNLSRCTRLCEVSVDLGVVSAEDASGNSLRSWDDAKVKAIQYPPKHEPFPALRTVEFSLDRWDNQCFCARCDNIWSSFLMDEECAGCIQTLFDYKAIPKQLRLGPHELLEKAWMLPVWASVQELTWSAGSRVVQDEGDHFETHRDEKQLMERMRSLPTFLRRNIDLFEAQTGREGQVVPRKASAVARDIQNLVHSCEDLQYLRYMLPERSQSKKRPRDMNDPDPDEVLVRLAEVLLSKATEEVIQQSKQSENEVDNQ